MKEKHRPVIIGHLAVLRCDDHRYGFLTGEQRKALVALVLAAEGGAR